MGPEIKNTPTVGDISITARCETGHRLQLELRDPKTGKVLRDLDGTEEGIEITSSSGIVIIVCAPKNEKEAEQQDEHPLGPGILAVKCETCAQMEEEKKVPQEERKAEFTIPVRPAWDRQKPIYEKARAFMGGWRAKRAKEREIKENQVKEDQKLVRALLASRGQ